MNGRKVVMLSILGLLSSAVVACGVSGGTRAHAIVGSWGAATQSGELVEAFSFASDGTYVVVDASGTGVQAASGRFEVLDDASVRTVERIGSDDLRVVFQVDGDLMSVVSGDTGAGQFRRMNER